MSAYLPVVGLMLVVTAALFAVAGNAGRRRQLVDLRGGVARFRSARLWRKYFSVRRVLVWTALLFLISYIWTYQRVQDAVADHLAASDIEKIAVGSLVIPWSAFFRSEYIADTGFSRSKKRTRTDITVTSKGWSGVSNIAVKWDDAGLAKINKLTGGAFTFSYLTDIKILRPAVDRFMRNLKRNGKIAGYEIETFDNRGPYIIVALNQADGDATKAATSFAEQLFTNLTKTQNLKVNQVVMKAVEREAYLADKTINIIGRGKAGRY